MRARTIAILLLAASALSACATYDNDDNPPGPMGGPGTNWENPPGPAGGPGASPDRYYRWSGERYPFSPRDGGYYYNDDFGYYHPTWGWWNQTGTCWRNPTWVPPGLRGRGGPVWVVPPVAPDRYGRCR